MQYIINSLPSVNYLPKYNDINYNTVTYITNIYHIVTQFKKLLRAIGNKIQASYKYC